MKTLLQVLQIYKQRETILITMLNLVTGSDYTFFSLFNHDVVDVFFVCCVIIIDL